MAAKLTDIKKLKEYVLKNSECELLSNEYIDKNQKMIFKCKCGVTFDRKMRNFKTSKFKCCPSCSNKKANDGNRLDIDFIKNEVSKNSNCILIESEYYNNRTKMEFECGCGNTFYTSWVEFVTLNKKQCNDCSNTTRYTTDDVKKYIEENSKCVLLSTEYENNHTKLNVICECGELFKVDFKKFKNSFVRSCRKCRGVKSNYEVYVENILKELDVAYIEQYTFKDCKNIKVLPFDFYLPKHNIIIEVDGEQHFRPFRFAKSENEFAETIYNDAIKNSYCEDNNIILIRIPYYKIKNSKDIIIKEINKHANTEVNQEIKVS